MRKRLSLFIVATNLMLMLTGCGENAIPNLTDEEMDAIGEYTAIMLMKYDANHRSRLVDLSEYEENQEELETSQEKEEFQEPESGSSEDVPVIEAPAVQEFSSIESFMELPQGVSVTYESKQVCNSYPEDDASEFFYLEAAEGKQLIALKFLVSNQSGSQQSIDFLNAGYVYRLQLNGTYARNALTTMLLDDMSSYIGTMESGDSEELVLLFEVEQEYANADQEMSLILKNDSKTYTIQAN